ncbi:RNA polymerase sigma factor [Alicyclobacillus fructus]|uniref:RNA polymerase sigma factor n=1 Tax=Alicyclobacillus fructus TaxID=2816082 RepID=UPI001A9005C1|nr:RNA polymerase sigma factor [Alicyclobacillus fructus]
MEVAQLVEACRQGLPESWNTLVSMFRPQALGWVTQFCRDRDLAEDVVQESWLTAARHLSELRNPQAFPRWFFQIVKTQAYRTLMQAYREQVEEMKEVASDVDQERSTVLKLDLERALDSLPLELKQVFILAGIYQWPIRDVASFLRIPAGTVKSRLSRARQQLQAALEEGGGDAAGQESAYESLYYVLSAWGSGEKVDHPAVRHTLARAWATMKSLRFTLIREWLSGEQIGRRQQARYTWRAPNWLRIETESPDAGRVVTIIHGRRMRVWMAKTNTIQEAQVPHEADPSFMLGHLWKELLTRDDLVVMPPEQGERLWHLWVELDRDVTAEEDEACESVHFWIHPEDGLPRRIEYWNGRGCVFREVMEDIEWNASVARREFNLPADGKKGRLWTLGDILGGIPIRVEPHDAIRQCPFPLLGLDRSVVKELGLHDHVEISKYYQGREWAVRYGAPARSTAVLRGEAFIILWQAGAVTDDVHRHWRISDLQDEWPQLGAQARSGEVITPRFVISRLYWEVDGRPYLLMASGISTERLVSFVHSVRPLREDDTQ